jgi:hypothetical protein
MRGKQVSGFLNFYLWLFLAIITLPAYFAVNWPYGDTLFLESLFVDLFEDGGHWSSWSQTTSPAYIPDLPLYFIAYHSLDYTMDRLFFVTFFQVMMVCAAMLFIVKYAVGELRLLPKFIIFAIYATFIFSFYRYYMWLFLNGSNFLMDSHIFTLLSLGLLLKMYREEKRRDWVLLALSVVIGILNGKAYLIWFFAPALATLGVCMAVQYYFRNPRFRTSAAMFGVIAASAVASSIIGPMISRWDTLSMVGRGRFNILEAFNSLAPFGNILLELMMGSRPMYAFWFALWIIGMAAGLYALVTMTRHYCFMVEGANKLPILSFLARMPTPQSGARNQFPWYFLVLFTLIMVPANFLIVTASGEFYNYEGLRYYQIAVTMPFLVLAGFVHMYFPKLSESRWTRYVIYVALTLCLALFLWNFRSLKPRDLTIDEVRNHKSVYEMEFAQCIDDHKEEYGLKYGLGDFWIAKSTSLLSKKGVRIYPIYGSWYSEAYFYMNNMDWFLGAPDSRHPNPEYNFLAATAIDFDIRYEVGEPVATFECPGSSVRVYDDTLDKVFKMRAANHLNAIKFQHKLLNEFTAQSPRPYMYLRLPHGHYQLEVNFRQDTTSPGTPVGTWEVGHVIGRRIHRAYLKPAPNGESTRHVMDFKVPFSLTGKEHDYLIRTIANDGLIIDSVTVKRL